MSKRNRKKRNMRGQARITSNGKLAGTISQDLHDFALDRALEAYRLAYDKFLEIDATDVEAQTINEGRYSFHEIMGEITATLDTEEIARQKLIDGLEAYRETYDHYYHQEMELIFGNARQAAADVFKEQYNLRIRVSLEHNGPHGHVESPEDDDPDFEIAARRRVFVQEKYYKLAPEPVPQICSEPGCTNPVATDEEIRVSREFDKEQ